MALCIFLS